VAQVNKGDNSLLDGVEVFFTEEAVVESDGGTLVNDSKALETSDLSGVEEGLALNVGAVGGNGEDNVTGLDVGLLEVSLEFGEIIANDLLNSELVLGAHLRHFETEFEVIKRHNFVGHEALLLFNLVFAVGVEAQEAGGEQNGVLEVLFNLESDCIANNAFSLRVGNLNTTKSKFEKGV
jgi:hypothetical protein